MKTNEEKLHEMEGGRRTLPSGGKKGQGFGKCQLFAGAGHTASSQERWKGDVGRIQVMANRPAGLRELFGS